MSEFLQIRKAVALTLALGIGAAACGGEDDATCSSPRSTSRIYAGDAAADPEDQATWRSGIEVKTSVPTNVEGLIVGFSGPNDPNWEDSKLVSPDKAKSIALRIGHGDVVFSTCLVADEGSAVYDKLLKSTFSEPETYDDVLQRGAVTPEWP